MLDIRDYKLRATDETTMRAALAAAGITVPEDAAPGAIIESQSPQWAVAWLGTLYEPLVTDPENGEAISGGEALPGWRADLRWIGPDAPDLSATEVMPEPARPLHGWL
ncbi:hypothetical protein [Ancylobacter sp. TS-1]|uniref:hypothetical protein n=1 Tax=Ancylobacter sp. TS-1 TaxID=1850374 RepID=UPI001265C534|nr:hypothetical protein [Ancylobacter sp. TS-1]QFR32374.1 hypothetical protein GBB76_04170 [Ancylobacter sp. TS-1]